MLNKKERISRKEFNEIFPISKTKRGSFFVLKKYNTPFFKASIVVSKKVLKSSVERHSLKRKIYDMLRFLNKESPLHGMHILLIQKLPTQEDTLIFEELKNILYV